MTSQNEMFAYINRYVDSLTVAERTNILQMIMNAIDDHSKIQTKGDGSQIKYRDIPEHIVVNIYQFVASKIADKMAEFNYFPDDVNKVEENEE